MKIKNNVIELTQPKYTSVSPAWTLELDEVQEWAYWDKVFTPEECARIIDIGESKIPQKASVINESADNKGIRDSTISWLNPSDDMEWAYSRITGIVTNLNSRFFNFDLFGFIEGFQFTKYQPPGGKYGRHIDKVLGGTIRKLSIVIQLSAPEDYEGGELVILNSEPGIKVNKSQGYMTVFPSYTLHEVTPVTKGTRYSLVAWIAGKPFK